MSLWSRMAPYMVKFKKTRKIIIFLAYEHRMPVVPATVTSVASAGAGTTGVAIQNKCRRRRPLDGHGYWGRLRRRHGWIAAPWRGRPPPGPTPSRQAAKFSKQLIYLNFLKASAPCFSNNRDNMTDNKGQLFLLILFRSVRFVSPIRDKRRLPIAVCKLFIIFAPITIIMIYGRTKAISNFRQFHL